MKHSPFGIAFAFINLRPPVHSFSKDNLILYPVGLYGQNVF
jgi:hypothetical protein